MTNKKEKKNESKGKKSKGNSGSNNAVHKVIVQHDDELTFVVDQINDTPSNRVIVSIPSGSDLLVSSIGARLISRHAAAKGKKIVMVTDDETGARVLRAAGFKVKSTISDVTDEIWESAATPKEQDRDVEEESKTGGLEASVQKEDSKVNMDFQDDFEREETGESGIPAPESAAGAAGATAAGKSMAEELDSQTPQSRKVSVDGFEMTIDEGSKSGDQGSDLSEPVSDPVGKVKSVPSKRVSDQKRSLVGRDFSGYESLGSKVSEGLDDIPTADSAAKPEDKKESFAGGVSEGFSGVINKVTGFFKSINFAAIKTALKGPKALRILGIGGVALIGLIIFFYWYLPEVVVTLEVESIAVEYEGEITASTTVDEMDEGELLIPATSETTEEDDLSKEGSVQGTAAGNKAAGSVIIFNNTTDVVSLPAGTILNNGGLNFTLDSAVELEAANPPTIPMTQANGNVTAEASGTNYNLVSGTQFSIGSYALGDVYAANSEAFTGGTADVKAVDQNDIDRVAGEARKELYAETKKLLADEHGDSRWVFVPESIKNEDVGEISSDVPVGTETDTLNVTVEGKSSALYYDGDALDDLIEQLLIESVEGDTDEMEGIELSDNIEQTITVKSASFDNGQIVLSVSVSGYVMPQFSEEKVSEDLSGMGWAEGLKYLKKIDYLASDPEVDFYPTWFPGFLKRMPSRGGRISVNIENIDPEEMEEESEEGDSSEDEESGEPSEE